jgi:nucleotide-binding universal stress UspA family protein
MDRVLEEDAQQQMGTFLKKVKKAYPDLTFSTKIVHGNAVDNITAIGDSGDFDYIVMGTKGASGLKKVFMGSVAGGVISKTKAPVLVVPHDHAPQAVKEILFAISQTPYSDEAVLEPLRKMASICQAHINVVHVIEEEAEEMTPDISELVAPIQDLNPTTNFIYEKEDINESLNGYIKERGCGILCLLRSKRGFLKKLFNESVTMTQTFNSSIPLLILHN